MLPNTTANISDGTANHVYDLRKTGDWSSTRYEAAAPSDQPATLEISHKEQGKGLKSTRSSLLRFQRVVEDADGNQDVIDAHLVVRYPTKIATTAQVLATTNEAINFFGVSTYKTQFLGGEI